MANSVGGTERHAATATPMSLVAPEKPTKPNHDPEQLIGRARNGDPEAIAELYRRHVGKVFGYLRANGCVNPEDATADVFEGMLKSIQRFTGTKDDFVRWLMTIAHRRLIDSRRRIQRRGHDQPLSELGGPRRLHFERSTSTGHSALTTDIELVRAIAGLTPEQRQVIGLRFIADLPIHEVAIITGRSPTGVKALQRRGLAALRRSLTDLDERG